MRPLFARLRARLPPTQLRWLAWGLALHLPMVGSDDWLWRELLALSGEWCVIVALGSWLAPRRGVALAVGVAWLGLAWPGLAQLQRPGQAWPAYSQAQLAWSA